MRTLFINGYVLKSRTPIESNVNDDILEPYIVKSQETHIQSYLGTNLYNKLMTEASAGTISGYYKTLLDDYVIPTLVEWALYEVLPFVSLKLTNKSIGRGNADYLAEADLDDLKYLRNAVREMGIFYGNRLAGYLKENSNNLPEYLTNSGLDEMKPQYKNNLHGGVYIPTNNCTYGFDYPPRKYYR